MAKLNRDREQVFRHRGFTTETQTVVSVNLCVLCVSVVKFCP